MNENKSPIWGFDRKQEACEVIREYNVFEKGLTAFYEPRAGGLYLIDDKATYLSEHLSDNKKRFISHKIAKNNLANKIFTKKSFKESYISKVNIITITDDFLKKVEERIKSGFEFPKDEDICSDLLKFLNENSSFGDTFSFTEPLVLERKNRDKFNLYKMQKRVNTKHSLDPRILSAYCYGRRDKSLLENQKSIELFFKENGDLEYFISLLAEDGLVDLFQVSSTNHEDRCYIGGIRISAKGKNKFQKNKDSKQIFVGMWFDDSVDLVYKEVFKPVIEELNFNPYCIKEEHVNKRLDDEIVFQIKRSRLVIVDLTAGILNPEDSKDEKITKALKELTGKETLYIPRANVYFEAGFAEGLDIPVIWTCKQEVFDLDQIPFDIRQHQILTWQKEVSKDDKFREKLKSKIKKLTS